jgi:hypothetical protein
MIKRKRKSENSSDHRRRWISALDLVVILDNVYRASLDKDIGFEDPRETLQSFLVRTNKMFRVYTEDVESGLWSCNLLSEKGKFRHPRGWSFDEFLLKILRGDTFNKDYNFIEGDKGSVI